MSSESTEVFRANVKQAHKRHLYRAGFVSNDRALAPCDIYLFQPK